MRAASGRVPSRRSGRRCASNHWWAPALPTKPDAAPPLSWRAFPEAFSCPAWKRRPESYNELEIWQSPSRLLSTPSLVTKRRLPEDRRPPPGDVRLHLRAPPGWRRVHRDVRSVDRSGTSRPVLRESRVRGGQGLSRREGVRGPGRRAARLRPIQRARVGPRARADHTGPRRVERKYRVARFNGKVDRRSDVPAGEHRLSTSRAHPGPCAHRPDPVVGDDRRPQPRDTLLGERGPSAPSPGAQAQSAPAASRAPPQRAPRRTWRTGLVGARTVARVYT